MDNSAFPDALPIGSYVDETGWPFAFHLNNSIRIENMVGCLVINVWLDRKKNGWLVDGWVDHITRQQQIMSVIYCPNLFVH